MTRPGSSAKDSPHNLTSNIGALIITFSILGFLNMLIVL